MKPETGEEKGKKNIKKEVPGVPGVGSPGGIDPSVEGKARGLRFKSPWSGGELQQVLGPKARSLRFKSPWSGRELQQVLGPKARGLRFKSPWSGGVGGR